MEAKAGGEVRRLHIIYFLSHMGRVDQPHLIRVHHLTRTGVYLRDIKRWLADLRGKEMAEAYAWSYKRRYKTGYVWQDLLDDDLITPISDNEYVLKGSEIISATFDAPSNIQYVLENKAASPVHKEQQQSPVAELVEEHKQLDQPKSSKQDFQTYPDSKIKIPIKTSSEINEESPHFGSDRSTLTDTESDESMKNIEDHSSSSFSFNSNREMNKKMMKKKKNIEGKDQMEGTPASSHSLSSSSSSSSSTATTTTSSKSAFTKSKSSSNGASHVFRNLMSCGAVDTNDSVLVMLNRRGGGDKSNATKQRTSSENVIFKGDKLGGSARVFGTCWHPQHSASSSSRKSCDGEKDNSKKKQQSQSQSQSEFTNQKAVSGAYRPVREPNCSQCGKPFKPEKMHSHMKSCRGMKALAKAAPTSSLKKTPSHSKFNDSASAYLLTN